MAQTYDRKATWEDPNEPGAVSGYRLKLGKQSGEYSQTLDLPPDAQTAAVTLDSPGNWFAVVTAFNADGESDPSNEAQFKAGPPMKQINLAITA